MIRIDLTGQKFGRLTVLELDHITSAEKHRVYWKCKCDCGNYHTTSRFCLRNGSSKSCGCYAKDFNRRNEPWKVTAKKVFNHNGGYNEADITFDDFLRLSQLNCGYCNLPPSNKSNTCDPNRNRYKEYDFIYSGLDRVDSSLLHTLDNVVPCCKVCNIAKHDMTREDFLAW